MGGALLGKQVKRQLDSLGGGYLGENQHKRKRRDLSSFHRRQLDSLGGGVLGDEIRKRQLDSLGGGVLGDEQYMNRQLDSLGGGVLGDELKRSASSESVEEAVENLMHALAKQYRKSN